MVIAMRGWWPALLALLVAAPRGAGATDPEQPDSEQPVTFTAERLVADRQAGRLELEGAVEIHHGAATITADRVIVLYDEAARQVTEVVALGSVRYAEADRRGRADRARYFPPTGLLVLEGEPVLWDGGSRLAGRQIRYERLRGRAYVERARAEIAPERLSEWSAPATGGVP